jgi:hypothetical protein
MTTIQSRVLSHAPIETTLLGVRVALLPSNNIKARPTSQTYFIGGRGFKLRVSASANATTTLSLVNANSTIAAEAAASSNVAQIVSQLVQALGQYAFNVDYDAGTFWIWDSVPYYVQASSNITILNTDGSGTIENIDKADTNNRPKAFTGIELQGVAAGATTLTTLNAFVGFPAQPGQFLCAIARNGAEYLVQLTAPTVEGSKQFIIAPAETAIPAGCFIDYPVEVFDRNDSTISETSNTASFSSYNTRGAESKSKTTKTANISLPGTFYERCPGYRTLKYADDNALKVYVQALEPPIGPNYLAGYFHGSATPTSFNMGRALSNGFVTNDISLEFNADAERVYARRLY